jgi:hypothetical protein
LAVKNSLYPAYVYASLTAVSEATNILKHNSAWEVQVKLYAEIGHLDLTLERMGDDAGVLQRREQVKPPRKDKKGGLRRFTMQTINDDGSRCGWSNSRWSSTVP